MRKDIIASVVAIVTFTLVFGLAYPLAMTGVSQVAFPGKADGSQIERDGKVVGSELIGQDFRRRSQYFQSRPSVTEYNAAGTFFNNLGPNSSELRDLFEKNMRTYLRLERPYSPGLTAADVPPDAVQTTASGVDPHISPDNAEIQARRVARVRNAPLDRVEDLVDDNTDGRFLGVIGEPGVNVLKLNLALDKELPTR